MNIRDIDKADESSTTTPKSVSIEKGLTLPIFMLLVYIVCTFFPNIYTIFPFLGTMRIVLINGILLVIVYLATRDRYRNETALKHSIFYAWMGFIILLAFGVVFSLDRGRSQVTLELCVKYMIMFIIMIKVIDSSERLNLVLTVFAWCAGGMAIFTIYYYISGRLFGEMRGVAIFAGIFADPNDLNTLLNAALPFMIYLVMQRWRTKLCIIGIIVIVCAVMLSFSRGGFLGMAIIGLGIYRFYGKMNKKYIFYLILAAILYFIFAPGIYLERLATIINWETDLGTGSTGSRLEAWRKLAVYTLRENPIFGAGPGLSIYVVREQMEEWLVIHNSLLQVFVDTGLTGFICFSALYIIPLREYRSIMKRYPDMPRDIVSRLRITLIALTGYLTTSIFLPQAYSPVLFMLTGIFLIQSELIKKMDITTQRTNR